MAKFSISIQAFIKEKTSFKIYFEQFSSYLLPERGRLAKQKTNVSRRTLSPKWEHTFTYKGVTLQELSTRALELSVWDRDRLTSNDFMGAVRLSLGSGKLLRILLWFYVTFYVF